jgi:triosephosphate isomerase
MHASIRNVLASIYGDAGGHIRILYGGSVKADNAAEILAVGDVGGALVGGASLSAESFLAIVGAAGAELED